MPLPLPKRHATEALKLADWLELSALRVPDRNYSSGNLESALNASSLFDGQGPDRVERKVLEVFNELERRAAACGVAYPFTVNSGVLQASTGTVSRLTYVFCLCLSYFGTQPIRLSGFYPRRMFEHIAKEVAAKFIGGQAIRFGAPRVAVEIPPGFASAVSALCGNHLGEGTGFQKGQQVHSAKDYGLDIVAWRDLPDRLPGKLVLFGACAAGWDWDGKLKELQPKEFCEEYMASQPVSPIVKAFFLPHRINGREWSHYSRSAGVIFDRCRISALVPKVPGKTYHGSPIIWTSSILRAIPT